MSSTPYYDQKLPREQVKTLLSQLGAKHLPERSKPGIVVYRLKGEGEAMAEAAPNSLVRVRLFKGRCAC